MTKALAMEWVQHSICVNSISPGVVATPLTRQVSEVPELLDHICQTTPMHRLGKVEEVVGGVIYLASDASSYTTGSDMIIDGGYTVW